MRILNYILPIALVGGVAFWAYRKLKNTRKDIRIELKKTPLHTNQVEIYTARLYQAMNKWGTDEAEIKRVYDVVVSKEGALSQMYKHFGFKKYAMGGEHVGGKALDLLGWLREELSGEDLNIWLDLAKKEGIY